MFPYLHIFRNRLGMVLTETVWVAVEENALKEANSRNDIETLALYKMIPVYIPEKSDK